MSVSKAFEIQGFNVDVTNDTNVISKANGLVLPGVGAFGDCMKNLNRLGLTKPIRDFIGSKKPFLGICLGLQVLFEHSEESPDVDGFGMFKGKVIKFPFSKDHRLKVPHMGWNQIRFNPDSSILRGIEQESWFYFVHSFYVYPENSELDLITSNYGTDFTAGIEKDNVFACQFHPEKSSDLGLKILYNFAMLCEEGKS